MAIDERLAARVRRALAGKRVVEKAMMGGLCFMVRQHMCCGVDRDRLMLRVGVEKYADALRRPHARPMDITGRPMRGFVFVGAAGVARQSQVDAWVRMALAFNASLPARAR